jgi:hypothetical protein
MSNDLPNLQVSVSPLSNRIFAGYSRPVKGKPGLMNWTRKQDVTKQAIDAVIRHLLDDKDGMEWEFVNDDSKVVVRLERMAREEVAA